MRIKNVTEVWEEARTREGLYIVRSTKADYRDRVRIGAGGNKGGTLGLLGRLRSHRKVWRQRAECETHKLQPFELIHAWSLEGWTQEQINDAEWCLWRAFLIRFPKHRGTLRDRSIFIVPENENLQEVVQAVQSDLEKLVWLDRMPIPIVEVPFQSTAIPRLGGRRAQASINTAESDREPGGG